jgi:hypothetical protein
LRRGGDAAIHFKEQNLTGQILTPDVEEITLSNSVGNFKLLVVMIQAGNRAYFANLSTIKSKIISRAAKLH